MHGGVVADEDVDTGTLDEGSQDVAERDEALQVDGVELGHDEEHAFAREEGHERVAPGARQAAATENDVRERGEGEPEDGR